MDFVRDMLREQSSGERCCADLRVGIRFTDQWSSG